MSFTEKWDKAFDAKDRDALAALLDDEFVFVRHQSGKEIPKEDMLNMWTSDGPRVVLNNYRVIYENDDIVVTHRFVDFPSGDKEAVLGVINLKTVKESEWKLAQLRCLHNFNQFYNTTLILFQCLGILLGRCV
jgi:hypothetical protein